MDNRYKSTLEIVSRTFISYKKDESYWVRRVASMVTLILLSGISILALPLKSMAEGPTGSGAGCSKVVGAVITNDEVKRQKSNQTGNTGPSWVTEHVHSFSLKLITLAPYSLFSHYSLFFRNITYV